MYRPRLLLALLGLFFFGNTLFAAPRVVTSIKPVDDLVRTVMEGAGQPVLLIPPGSSPHVYALRPSERLAVERAEVLFWIGPQVESALVRVSRVMRPEIRVVTLSQAPGIQLLPARVGGQWDRHGHAEENHHRKKHEHEHEHGHGKHDIDGHLWLSPANAAAILRTAAATLSEVDRVNAGRYAANAEVALQRLKALDAELAGRLAPVRGRPFIVFHDAYQYFENSYRLYATGSVLISPEAMSSAGRVRDLRRKIGSLGAVCVFAEPQFEPRLVQTLIAGTPARAGVLDPMGASLPSGWAGYAQLMRNLAGSLSDCLAR